MDSRGTYERGAKLRFSNWKKIELSLPKQLEQTPKVINLLRWRQHILGVGWGDLHLRVINNVLDVAQEITNRLAFKRRGTMLCAKLTRTSFGPSMEVVVDFIPNLI